MSYLSANDILKADDLPMEEMVIPDWPAPDGTPGIVRVRGLTGTERDRFEFKAHAFRNSPEGAIVRADLVARCLVDENGKRLFTDKQIRELGDKNSAPLDQIFDVIRRLSGMTEGAVEDAAEDFGEGPNDGSPTGSQAI